ncbi:putative nuclease HARBI1 isoform X1 [Photinus pyralis]|uniref:putative nuclease HARBI1 isoform X1 n=1 Tax=Photinus pyralis TaxID=7054 RepID=UPI00126707FB|nr:putative nuclease HARBI1 isoform X1 [Photinus pyralis]
MNTYLKTKCNFDSAKVPGDKQLYVTLWTLANKDSYREVGNLFGLSKSTVNFIFHKVCKLLTECRNDFIKWPTAVEQTDIKRYVHSVHRFPNTVGFIDGCHIQIKAPSNNPTDFYNRKDVHSIVLQGTCDHTLKFIDIYLGQTGRSHDARVFRESPLSDVLNQVVPSNCHILGDSAYPLLTRMMTPYRDTGHLTASQKKYNTIHAKSRAFIERAFGRLKGKFRRLKYLEVNDITGVTDIVCAACVLHNFILTYEPDNLYSRQQQEDIEIDENLSASEKRLLITNYIS